MSDCKNTKDYHHSDNSGQTLIETLVAIFILISGVTAAVGLAIFAFGNSQNVVKQIVAVGLAREGIEAVKNMRDTNWLKDNLKNDCYNPKTSNNDGRCYKDWNDEVSQYNINPNSAKCQDANIKLPSGWDPDADCRSYRLRYNVSTNFWNDFNQADNFRYGLNFNGSVDNDFDGFYTYPNSGGNDPGCGGSDHGVCHTNATSDYARQIIVYKDDGVAQYGSDPTRNPFIKPEYRRLRIVSRVWWTDKKCPRSNTWPGAGNCAVELQTYLTNWKNY